MTRVKNADDFLVSFRKIAGRYEELFGPKIESVRAKLTNEVEKDSVNKQLEAHVRAYLINGLLSALNWCIDPKGKQPNIFPEAPVRSEKAGSVRFLDYLGVERQTENPLLIVETKRPSAELPRLESALLMQRNPTHAEIISAGLAGSSLIGKWDEWLEDMKDYVRSISEHSSKIPVRVVITNGDWLILFLDPSNAFSSNRADASKIIIFTNRDDIERRFHDVYHYLEYEQVLGKAPALTPTEIPFYINPESIDKVISGVRLRYAEVSHIYKNSPVVYVAPIVFIHSCYGNWIRVESPPNEFELPHNENSLQQHLDEVELAARKLLNEINQKLNKSLHTVPIQEHYADQTAFESLMGVNECGADDYLIITGSKTHYLLPTPSVPNCPYHEWAFCHGDNVESIPGPIMMRSVSPRSFFRTNELHHCAHKAVSTAKAARISQENRQRCEPRSGFDGQAFCEIWRFEQHLCCRTCVFEEVCTKATVFELPCRRE